MSGLLDPRTDNIPITPKADLPAPVGNPGLLWPSIAYGTSMQNCDLPYFPYRNLVIQRYRSEGDILTLGLQSFQSAITQAQVCVLVLDVHFDEVGSRVLGAALEYTRAEDIRLLTGSGKIDEQKRVALNRTLRKLRNMNSVNSPATEVYWTAGLIRRRFPYLHDRFAIVDGGLWHFGSTVGGGSRELSAASGPWPVSETRAKKFFDECWREHGD